MPDFRDADNAALADSDPYFSSGWKLRPFPETWEDLRSGVNAFLEHVWGTDWRCPHCGGQFWTPAEAVGLDSASAWPIPETSYLGSYPVVPVVCSRCNSVFPVLLLSIFERKDEPEASSA